MFDKGAAPRSGTVSVLRTELFSDAVLAIALTLLVLDLSINETRPGELGATVLQQVPTYLAFFASFLYIAVIWLNHHSVFHKLTMVTLPILWVNFGILFVAVLLPFPTAVLATAFEIGNDADQRAAVLFYGGLAFLMGLTWNVLFLVISKSPKVWSDPNDGPMWRAVTKWSVGGAFGYLAAVLAGFLISPFAGIIGFILLVAYRATQASRITNWHERHAV